MEIPYAPLPMEQDDVEYGYGPESFLAPDVPRGRTIAMTLDGSDIFPGTVRRVYVHVPHGVPTDEPVAATIVQDGSLYLDPDAAFRCDVVLDHLVTSGAVPPMVGIFVDPGVFPLVSDPEERRNRNAEYDAFDSRYADLLVDEVLPRAREHVVLSDDPRDRCLVGGSSSGNGSFTAAWHRPEDFGRVVSLGGSFAQIRGGNPYPALIGSTPRKPLRVLLSAAHRDLWWNEPDHNWFAENLLVAAALAKAGYDMRLVLREGGHSMVNGGALLPDALRWVWR